jgi:plastocyanin
MNKFLLAASVFALLGAAPMTASASSDLNSETVEAKRISHYKGQSFATKDQAISGLQDNNVKVKKLLDSADFGVIEMEDIHQISYTLETAIDKLIADKSAATEKLEAVDEAVQAIHHASENHEEEKLRLWFTKLEQSVTALTDETVAVAQPLATIHEITIKNHIFTPDEIHVPAGKRVKLIVHNQDSTPEEFESDDFGREKIILGNSTATIFVSPLKAGKYHFFGEFNSDLANGYLIAE